MGKPDRLANKDPAQLFKRQLAILSIASSLLGVALSLLADIPVGAARLLPTNPETYANFIRSGGPGKDGTPSIGSLTDAGITCDPQSSRHLVLRERAACHLAEGAAWSAGIWPVLRAASATGAGHSRVGAIIGLFVWLGPLSAALLVASRCWQRWQARQPYCTDYELLRRMEPPKANANCRKQLAFPPD
ncbi:hypothetical protein FBY03_12925 [Pseudomonas sp. SJZ079]|nr:hypothetical protein FBY03_12925 [Pseudomonas sp. SJZ079]